MSGTTQMQPQLRIELKPMPPPTFSGATSQSADQWLVEVERYFLAAGLTVDPKRAQTASTYLRDAASTWYTSEVSDVSFTAAPSWDLFKERFLARFRPIAAARVARADMRNLKHRHRVAGYAQAFQKLVQLIPDMSVTDQIENFIHGLQHHIAMEVDREMPKTLSQAMEVAQRVELRLATRGSHGMHGRRGMYANYSSSSSHSSNNTSGGGDAMDLSAIRGQPGYMDEKGEFHAIDADAPEHLHFMSHRGRGGGHYGGRGGGRGGFRGGRKSNLSREEFDRLSREGKCFECKEAGHLGRNCPKRKDF